MGMPNTARLLRARRMEKDLTIEGLAFAAGVSVATVIRAERPEWVATERTLRRLAKALDLDIEALLQLEPTEAAS